MRFYIDIDTDNAAFEDRAELASIIHDVAERLYRDDINDGDPEGTSVALRDINGNHVGDAGFRPDGPEFVIWSHEHLAFWRPARQGYTTDAAEAGRYSLEEAAEICFYVIPAGQEIAIPATDLSHFDYRAGLPQLP